MEAENNNRPTTPIQPERIISCPGAPKRIVKWADWTDLLDIEIVNKKLDFDAIESGDE